MRHQLFPAWVLAAAAATLPSFAAAQPVLEVVPLRHRTAEQVLPALRLLLEPGGTLSGHGNQLFVRTSPENFAELKQVLAAIDHPLRRLAISVRFADAASVERSDVQAGTRIGSRGARVDLRARDERTERAERVDQRVQVLEGGRARILAGRSALIGGARYEAGTGFDVVPRLSGESVLVDVAAASDGRSAGRIVTTVNARLGEWFYEQGVWLKVEEVP